MAWRMQPRWRVAAEGFVRGGSLGGSGGPQRRLRRWESSREIAKDLPGEDFVDLPVPGHRLGATGLWLMKDVVPSSVAEENTASLLQFSDQIRSFQATTSAPTVRIPGKSSLANSW